MSIESIIYMEDVRDGQVNVFLCCLRRHYNAHYKLVPNPAAMTNDIRTEVIGEFRKALKYNDDHRLSTHKKPMTTAAAKRWMDRVIKGPAKNPLDMHVRLPPSIAQA